MCSTGACVADCFIGGTLIPAGTVNPANACEVCTPGTSTTTWSNEPDGTGCATGEVCSSGTCATDCFIGGVLIPAGTVNPANACEVCTPGTSTTTWSNEPDGTGCATGEVCSSGTCATDCFIGGVLFPAGTVNPANACQVCTPATSTTTWSNEPSGTACAAGEVCSTGACVADCFIGGVLIPAGTVNPANACQVCTPATSTTTWSNEPSGTACAAGEVCSSGTCIADCFIGGVLIPAGTVNPANVCQVCTPGASTTTWSNEPNGMSCGGGEVCGGGNCGVECFIGGVLYPTGTVNPANACQVCAPGTSTTAWSNEPSGTACAAGEVCSTGTCIADCFIGGTLIPAGTVNPANACRICAPGTSTTTWSNEPDGTSCGGGEVCGGGTCGVECFIGGVLIPTGTVNPANACQVCAPGTSTTAWSNEPDGTSCATGEVCSTGTCVADCFIGGTLFPAGTVNPANACQICAPATSTTTWSNEPDGTSCATGEVCSSGACSMDCFIGGVVYAAGTVNPANACQVCTPGTSTTAWSNEPDGTSCATGEVCSSGACSMDCFIGGMVYAAGTVNPTNACQVCTPATSTTAWSNEPDGASCADGEVCSSGACAMDCFIGGAIYTAGTVNPTNACQVCTPATSTTAWSNEPNGTSCAGGTCQSGTCATSSTTSSSSGGTGGAGSSTSSSSGTGTGGASSSSSGTTTSTTSSSSGGGAGGSATTTTTTTSGGGGGDAGDGLVGSGGGCNCEVAGETPRAPWLLGLLPLLAMRRRRSKRGERDLSRRID